MSNKRRARRRVIPARLVEDERTLLVRLDDSALRVRLDDSALLVRLDDSALRVRLDDSALLARLEDQAEAILSGENLLLAAHLARLEGPAAATQEILVRLADEDQAVAHTILPAQGSGGGGGGVKVRYGNSVSGFFCC
jgi:hypothetical protein